MSESICSVPGSSRPAGQLHCGCCVDNLYVSMEDSSYVPSAFASADLDPSRLASCLETI